MAVQTPDTKEEQDSSYNPGDIHAAEQFGTAYSSAGTDQAEAFVNDPANASEKLKDKEETPDEIPFTGSGSAPTKQSIKGKLFGSVKKNSAVTSIIGLLLTGAFGLSLLSPGLLLVQLKETLTDKFNDQLATMDIRQTAILKKKLSKTTTSGVCGKTLTIRCKYQTLGDRHLKRLEKAGIKVVGEKNVFGRTRPVSFEFEGKSITAPQLLNEARSSPSLRSAMRHGYNPKFAAFSDAIAAKVNTKLGLKKSKNITPSADKDTMKQQLKDNASGKTAAGDGAPAKYPKEDGTEGYRDAAGGEITKSQYEALKAANDEIKNRASLADDIKKAGLKSGIKGALTSTAFGAGAADSLCTAWVVIRVAGFAAKVYGQRQLIRYSYQFMNTADAIKAGDATPEEVAYLSDILTSTNSEGRSATDSHGYRYAAYSDIFNTSDFDTSVEGDQLTDAATDKNVIQNETSKYVNGQILPDNLMSKIVSALKQTNVSAADNFCGTVKSWQGQVAIFTLAVGGLIAAFFTGGGTLGVGVALQVAAGVVASVVLAVITPKLIDMAKGEMITGDENGNEAGNAITSGMGGYNAQISQGRGLAVLDKQDAVEYARITETTVADYAEVDRSELSPFDTSSKHTFLGSIANTLIPYASKMGSGGSTVSSMASLVTHSLSGLATPKTNAADMTAKELNSCEDYEYKGLAADPFCNLRYGMSKNALNTDPEVVLDYMEKGKYIDVDSEDGSPGGENGSQYQEYIDQCIERESSIGDNLSNDEGAGENCTQGKGGGNENRNTMFRDFHIDMSIQEGMDSEFQNEAAAAPTDAESITVATYNIQRTGLGGSPAKAKKAAQLMKERGVSIVGAQEVDKSEQYEPFLSGLGSNYAGKINDSGGGGRAIFWDTNLFTLGKSGLYTTRKDGEQKDMVWVELKASSGKSIYVFSMHTDPHSESTREANAQDTLNEMERVVGTSGSPVIITGDMNGNYKDPSRNAVFEKFTNSGKLDLTTFKAKTKIGEDCDTKGTKSGKQECGRSGYGSHLDQIWVSKNSGITVNTWENIATSESINISDHNPVLANLSIEGVTGEGGSTGPISKDGWVWPIAATESKPGPCFGGDSVHAGLDINSDGDGKVYAMHDGKVVTIIDGVGGDSPATGNHIMIKTPEGVYYGYQHLKPGQMKVAVNDTVKAGQVIAVGGKTGNVDAVSKVHLHITMSRKNTVGSYGSIGDMFDPMTVLADVKPSMYTCG